MGQPAAPEQPFLRLGQWLFGCALVAHGRGLATTVRLVEDGRARGTIVYGHGLAKSGADLSATIKARLMARPDTSQDLAYDIMIGMTGAWATEPVPVLAWWSAPFRLAKLTRLLRAYDVPVPHGRRAGDRDGEAGRAGPVGQVDQDAAQVHAAVALGTHS